jgi:hypothetical protein
MIQEGYNQRAIISFQPILDRVTCQLLEGFANTPEHFLKHIRRSVKKREIPNICLTCFEIRYAASIIMKTGYGHHVESEDDFYVQLANTAMRESIESGKNHEDYRLLPRSWLCSSIHIQTGTPGTSIIDLIPPLRHLPAWLPGLSSKRAALGVREKVNVC